MINLDIGKEFDADEQAEQDGIWIEYSFGSVRIKPADESNKSLQRAFAALRKKYKSQLRRGKSLIDVITEDDQRRLYAEHVVNGWRGPKPEAKEGEPPKNGDAVHVSVDECIATFKRWPRFFSDVVQQASNFDLFRKEEREEDAKN